MTRFVSAYLGARYRTSAEPQDLSVAQKAARRRIVAASRDEDWENCDCLCGGTAGRLLSEVDRYGLPYSKVLCSRCGLLRVAPRWTEAKYRRFYAEEYRNLYSPQASGLPPEQMLRQLAEGPGAKMVSRFVIDAWQRYGNPRRTRPSIVEIGAGGGWNLSRLPGDWNRIGFDTDERFLQMGRELFGIDMRHGFFNEALAVASKADCVLLSHVLEHVADPVETLRKLRETVRDDALVLIEVPGIYRLHKTAGDPMRYWQNAHTFTFCARTAADTCRRAGLEPVAIDEWIRLVLRPAGRPAGPVNNDAAVALSIERYLRYCETTHQIYETVRRLPIIGSVLGIAVRRLSDAVMRGCIALGLVHGVRAGVMGSEHDVVHQ